MIEYFNEDCMTGMARYPDKHFDLAIVDPPYGIGIDGQKLSINKNPKHNRKAHAQKEWDCETPDLEYFRELERVSKNQIVWGGNYFVPYLNQGKKGWVVWDKGQHGLTMSDCELAYSTFNVPTRIFVQNRVVLLQEGNTIHPTQKPIKLYKWLLKNYAKSGDKILDTHVGSASSLIACHDMGFDAVGFELDPDYYKSSKQRLEDFMAQPKLTDVVIEQREQIGLEEV